MTLVCVACGVEKPVADFYMRSPGKPRRDCKDCCKRRSARLQNGKRSEYQRQYRAANLERLTEAARVRRLQPAEQRRHLEKQRHYRRTKPELERARKRRYLATDRGRAVWRAQSSRRRARMDGTAADTADWRIIIKTDPCSYCGAPGSEADHIDPVAHGGLEEWENLTSSCRSCNASKGTRTLLMFIASSAW